MPNPIPDTPFILEVEQLLREMGIAVDRARISATMVAVMRPEGHTPREIAESIAAEIRRLS